MEYGVLARERFLRRLPQLRGLGTFKELLEPGGAILYRNLFRDDQLEQAWQLMTALRPWHDRLVCYVRGVVLPMKEVQEILWCAGFLRRESPCRGASTARTRPIGCPGARLQLGPGEWDAVSDDSRHALSFARVDGLGMLRFDREAVAAFLAASPRARSCPASPARVPERMAAALEEVPVRSLGWPLVAELSEEWTRRLGREVLEGEHGFTLPKGAAETPVGTALELTAAAAPGDGGAVPALRVVDAEARRGPPLTSELRLPKRLREAALEGVVLRGVQVQESYVRGAGGHYELEHRFVLTPRVHLAADDRPERFQTGYRLTTFPRATPEYAAWVGRVCEALP